MTTYRLLYRKRYRTGSSQTARRSVVAANAPEAVAKLERSISRKENVRISILAMHYMTSNGEWIRLVENEDDRLSALSNLQARQITGDLP